MWIQCPTIGCKVIIERTFTFEDKCGNQTRCKQTLVYYVDDIPSRIDCGLTIDLGCNPQSRINSQS